nr:MAG TPA: hypothetical protein [Caudoviricetes sp.]
MCEEYDYTNVEPTEEIMKLWTVNPEYSRDEVEYIKCSDSEVRPIDFHNWSADTKHDYSKRPKFPQDDYTNDGWFDYKELVRCGLIQKVMSMYGEDMRNDVINYLKKLKEVKGEFTVKQLLGVSSSATMNSYLNKQRRIPDGCLNEVLHDLSKDIEGYSPNGILTYCDAGYELMFIQRWFYRVLMEVKYV